MVTTGVNRGAIKVSLFAPIALKKYVIGRKTMINGTCVHCDAEQDLVPICISCANKKVTTVVEKGCNSPSTAVSQEIHTPPPDSINNAFKRLKDECGYGVPDGHE